MQIVILYDIYVYLEQCWWLFRIFPRLPVKHCDSDFLLDLGKLGLEAAKHLIWLKIGCKTETTLTTTAICNSLYWVFPSVESGRSNRPLLFGTKKIRWTKYRSSYKQKPFPGCRARPNKTMTMIILTRTVTTLRAWYLSVQTHPSQLIHSN